MVAEAGHGNISLPLLITVGAVSPHPVCSTAVVLSPVLILFSAHLRSTSGELISRLSQVLPLWVLTSAIFLQVPSCSVCPSCWMQFPLSRATTPLAHCYTFLLFIWFTFCSFFHFSFFYVYGCFTCMYICVHICVCAWCPWRPEEVVRPPRTEVTADCKPPVLGIKPKSSGRSSLCS